MADNPFHPPASTAAGQPKTDGTSTFEGNEGTPGTLPRAHTNGQTSTFEGYESALGTLPNAGTGLPHALSPLPEVAVAWPEPQPLRSELQPVEILTPEHLPNALVPFVSDIADRMQCPPDFVAAAALTALGSVIGTRLAIRPKRHDEWLVTPNLWCMIVGRPGVMKSPAVSEAISPLMRLEINARIAFEKDSHARNTASDIYKARRKAYEESLKRAILKSPNGPIQIEAPIEPHKTYARRHVVNDTTYEALGEIAAQNKQGLLVHRDELMSLLISLDREENINGRSFYLTSWDGNQPYTFDRISRDQTHINPLCLSVLGTTQPGRLISYIGKIQKGGGADDGLLQRFGLIIFPDQSSTWNFVDRPCEATVRANIEAMFTWIADAESFNFFEPSYDRNDRAYLVYADDALAEYIEWLGKLEHRIRGKDLHPAFESHLAKYRKLVPALSLINHLVDGKSGPVSLTALRKSIKYVEYLETHAQRAYSAGFNMGATTARLIANRLKHGGLEKVFTLRDIHQKDWSGLTDREQVQLGLERLCDADWLQAQIVATGGRTKTNYTVNPRIFVRKDEDS
ncbi:DUF3987 domain-containing protein [Methylobacterium sp. WL18]|uniref:YfjI family protein n=1 Tax=Methylobacterium sp. WL18 TaxID=2603897 RepID=UPI0011CA9F9D|nr:YfjI family protein [Methylobacterium sp. WL18]TXN72934.1 DUF3987 domain-containing protein [Methylobacterium sp. WL18]